MANFSIDSSSASYPEDIESFRNLPFKSHQDFQNYHTYQQLQVEYRKLEQENKKLGLETWRIYVYVGIAIIDLAFTIASFIINTVGKCSGKSGAAVPAAVSEAYVTKDDSN